MTRPKRVFPVVTVSVEATAEEIERTTALVTRKSRGEADERMLLDALGLVPDTSQVVPHE